MMETYSVYRHGGRATDQEREIYHGEDLALAMRLYRKIAEGLRQGRVTVRVDGGATIASASGPTLRTRW